MNDEDIRGINNNFENVAKRLKDIEDEIVTRATITHAAIMVISLELEKRGAIDRDDIATSLHEGLADYPDIQRSAKPLIDGLRMKAEDHAWLPRVIPGGKTEEDL